MGFKENGKPIVDKIGSLQETITSKQLRVLSSDLINPKGSNLVKQGFKSFMNAPIVIDDTAIAVLNVASKIRDSFDTREQLWFQQITSLMSSAIQKQNLLEQTQTALNETALQAKRLAELNKLSKELMAAPSHEAICIMVLNEVSKLIESELTTFSFLTEDKQSLATYKNSTDGKNFEATGRVWELDTIDTNVSIGEALAHKDIIHSNFEESSYLDCQYLLKLGLKSGLAVPLIIDDKVLGTLNVNSKEANTYTKQDKAFMLQLASLVAATIENKNLFDKSQQTLEKLKDNEQALLTLFQAEERKSNELILLERIQSAITNKLSLEQIFETAVKTIVELLDYRAISIGHVKRGRIHLHPLHSHGYDGFLQAGYSVALNEGIQGLALSQASAILVPFVHENPHYNLVIADVVSNIAVPIFGNDSIMAVLVIEHTALLTQSDVNLLTKITEQLTIAIENATLHEQVLTDLQQTEALYAINKLLYSTQDFQDSLHEVVAITTETISAQWLVREVYDPTHKVLIPEIFYKGERVEILSKSDQQIAALEHPNKDRLAYRAVDTKKAMISTQILNTQILNSSDKRLQHSLGSISTMAVPVFEFSGKDKVLGIITVNRLEDTGNFTEADLSFFKSMVHQVSIAREQQQLNKRIKFQAFHDALTKLPNRSLFEIKLKQEIKEASDAQTQVGLIYLDLDGFKHVNDTLGHDTGDELLQLVTTRLSTKMRSCDTLARMGGDEFAIILSNIESRKDAIEIATRYLEIIEKPFLLEATQIIVTASIGVSIFPEDGADVSTLLKHSDIAMYLAKNEGRNGVRSFSEHMAVKARERLILENNLRLAVENKDFVLHYQAQYCLTTGRLIGAEALIRWNHPTDGLIAPYKFIPMAEETLLIIEMGKWALIEACKQTKAWHRQGCPITISVNVAAPQFIRNNFIETVTEALEISGLAAEYLELEVTESVVMHNIDLVAVRLQELRNLGVSIALDDFGTGFSSLKYLQKLPFDKLKIDRSFIMNIGESENDIHDRILLQNIMRLATGFELKVVAEGIETSTQDSYLKSLGCQYAQGFYYAKPLPAEQVLSAVQTIEI